MAAGKKAKKRGTRKRAVKAETELEQRVGLHAEEHPVPYGAEDDQFYIPQSEIPKGWTYQWVAKSVTGDEDIVAWQQGRFLEGGWRPVPFKRHAERFASLRGANSEFIERGRQILCERPRALTQDALARGRQAARALLVPKNEDDGTVEIFGNVGAAEVAWNINVNKYQGQANEVRHDYGDGGDRIIDVSIRLHVPANLVDAARTCQLSVDEYVRRMLLMVLRKDLPGVLLPSTKEAGTAFELMREVMWAPGAVKDNRI